MRSPKLCFYLYSFYAYPAFCFSSQRNYHMKKEIIIWDNIFTSEHILYDVFFSISVCLCTCVFVFWELWHPWQGKNYHACNKIHFEAELLAILLISRHIDIISLQRLFYFISFPLHSLSYSLLNILWYLIYMLEYVCILLYCCGGGGEVGGRAGHWCCWPCSVACRISFLPDQGLKWSHQWKHKILTTRPPGNSVDSLNQGQDQLCQIFLRGQIS